MNVSLYEISADFLKALDGLEVDEETGEIMNFDAVEALDAQFEDKAESVACYIKNLSAFAADLKAEEENLSARRKTVERRVDSVKKYLSSCLVTVGKDKVETAKARISFRKSIQVQIDDEAALPADYVTTTVTTKPDQDRDQESDPGRRRRDRGFPGREPEHSDQVKGAGSWQIRKRPPRRPNRPPWTRQRPSGTTFPF